jgi:uncharacterized membrane protein required for colicin V production
VLDFLLGIYLAVLAARGWLRGFVREALDLVGLILGVVIAFRLSEPVGNFVSDRFGVSPEWARISAGVALFVLVGFGLSLVARLLSRVMRLPGLNLLNRLGGAVVGVAWASLLLILAVSVLRAMPLPAAEEAIDDSVVARALTNPEAPTQRLFLALAGDRVLDSLLALGPLLGDRRAVLDPEESVAIPPADAADLDPAPSDATLIFELINRARLDQGLSPLVWSEGLAEVAQAHAEEMYRLGYVSHVSPNTGRVTDRVAAAGIRLMLVGENLALAASARAAHAGLMDSPGHRANILHTGFDRVGVGAVLGPYGLMVVEVFGG